MHEIKRLKEREKKRKKKNQVFVTDKADPKANKLHTGAYE
jgi:hypothetical protein